jgi:sporulation protein YlmC with PRC-barrel domain
VKLADLYGRMVIGSDGERIGRVHEVRAAKGRVAFLDCGAASFVERFTSRPAGRAVRWEQVARITPDAILLGEAKKSAPARRKKA